MKTKDSISKSDQDLINSYSANSSKGKGKEKATSTNQNLSSSYSSESSKGKGKEKVIKEKIEKENCVFIVKQDKYVIKNFDPHKNNYIFATEGVAGCIVRIITYIETTSKGDRMHVYFCHYGRYKITDGSKELLEEGGKELLEQYHRFKSNLNNQYNQPELNCGVSNPIAGDFENYTATKYSLNHYDKNSNIRDTTIIGLDDVMYYPNNPSVASWSQQFFKKDFISVIAVCAGAKTKVFVNDNIEALKYQNSRDIQEFLNTMDTNLIDVLNNYAFICTTIRKTLKTEKQNKCCVIF